MSKQQSTKNLTIQITQPKIPNLIKSSKKSKSKSNKYSQDIEARQKYQISHMQIQVRKLSQKIQAQQQLLRNRIFNQQLQNQLKKNQIAAKMSKKEIILKRLNNMIGKQQYKQKPKQNLTNAKKYQSNKVSAQIQQQKFNSKHVKFSNAKINDQMTSSNIKWTQNMKNGLQQMRKLRYNKEQAFSQQKQTNKSLKKLSKFSLRAKSQRNISKSNSPYISVLKYSKHNQQLKIQRIKQIIQKQKQYGNRVQKQYHSNRSKSAQSYLQIIKQQQQQQKAHQINERNRILSMFKKPQIPYVDSQRGRKYQIQKIRKSPEKAQHKLSKLNYLSELQVHRIMRQQLKKKQENYETLNHINKVRADIMLDH